MAGNCSTTRIAAVELRRARLPAQSRSVHDLAADNGRGYFSR